MVKFHRRQYSLDKRKHADRRMHTGMRPVLLCHECNELTE